MLHVLQKEYTMDLVEFGKWQEMIKQRQTFMGKLSYKIGQVIAVYFIVRLGLSVKQIARPSYGDETIGKWLRYFLSAVGLIQQDEVTVSEELALTVSIQLI